MDLSKFPPVPEGLNPDDGAIIELEKHHMLWARTADVKNGLNFMFICSQQKRGGAFHLVCRIRNEKGEKTVYRKVMPSETIKEVAIANAKDVSDEVLASAVKIGASFVHDSDFTFRPYKTIEELIQQFEESGMFDIFTSPKK